MLSRIWQYIIAFITGRLDELQTDQQIAGDKKTIEEKVAETAPILANIDQLKAQQYAKSGEITVLTDKVAVDDAAVVKAEADTRTATERIAAIKGKKGVTQEELEAKLRDIK